MYDVAATPDTSLSTSYTLPVTELSTYPNLSSPTEQVAMPQREIQTTPPNSKHTAATSTSISPLVFRLPQETARKVKKIEARDRSQYVRCGMDLLFTREEMAASNLDGKRNKRKLDEARVDLLQRKLKLLIVWILR